MRNYDAKVAPPVKAIRYGKITHNHNCTMCYRCINKCPKKAIRVLLRCKVKKQYKGIKKGEETA